MSVAQVKDTGRVGNPTISDKPRASHSDIIFGRAKEIEQESATEAVRLMEDLERNHGIKVRDFGSQDANLLSPRPRKPRQSFRMEQKEKPIMEEDEPPLTTEESRKDEEWTQRLL